jgi:hypothetical protein
VSTQEHTWQWRVRTADGGRRCLSKIVLQESRSRAEPWIYSRHPVGETIQLRQAVAGMVSE